MNFSFCVFVYFEFRNVYITISIKFNIFFYNMTDQDKFMYLMEFHLKEVSVYLEKT